MPNERLVWSTRPATKHTFLTPNKLLSRLQLARLSRVAQRLFAGVYDRIEHTHRYNQPSVWLDDADMQRRVNCLPEQFALALNELILAKLLIVQRVADRTNYALGAGFVKPANTQD